MLRTRLVWTGGGMGEGVSVLNLDGAETETVDDIITALSSFAAALVNVMPSGTSIIADNVIDVVTEASGQLITQVSGTPIGAQNGQVAGSFAAGVGARIRWVTAGVRNGTPVRGTTFVVPLATSQYESNGTLTSGCVTALTSAGSALLGTLNANTTPLAVYSRPGPGGSPAGELHPVTSIVVPDQVSWLTTRRS